MSDNGFRLFRSKVTGKTGLYPTHFATWPDFEEIDPETGETLSGDAPVEPEVPDLPVAPASLEKRK